jgi:hypothetical protein
MKKIIQVIGLPGSGKSTQIKKYLEQAAISVDLIDIVNFQGARRDLKFRRAVIKHRGSLIAESACGIKGLGYIIKINTPVDRVYAQLLDRDNCLDEDYLSLLGTQMVAADCTLKKPEDLPGLLETILKE